MLPHDWPSASDLFTPDVSDAPARVSDREMLRDASAAADILAMGSDSEGIAVHTVLRLRGELVAALEALARRWHMDVSA